MSRFLYVSVLVDNRFWRRMLGSTGLAMFPESFEHMTAQIALHISLGTLRSRWYDGVFHKIFFKWIDRSRVNVGLVRSLDRDMIDRWWGRIQILTDCGAIGLYGESSDAQAKPCRQWLAQVRVDDFDVASLRVGKTKASLVVRRNRDVEVRVDLEKLAADLQKLKVITRMFRTFKRRTSDVGWKGDNVKRRDETTHHFLRVDQFETHAFECATIGHACQQSFRTPHHSSLECRKKKRHADFMHGIYRAHLHEPQHWSVERGVLSYHHSHSSRCAWVSYDSTRYPGGVLVVKPEVPDDWTATITSRTLSTQEEYLSHSQRVTTAPDHIRLSAASHSDGVHDDFLLNIDVQTKIGCIFSDDATNTLWNGEYTLWWQIDQVCANDAGDVVVLSWNETQAVRADGTSPPWSALPDPMKPAPYIYVEPGSRCAAEHSGQESMGGLTWFGSHVPQDSFTTSSSSSSEDTSHLGFLRHLLRSC